MAVKIYCSACKQFIKDASFREMTSLTGHEICASCESRYKACFDAVELLAKNAPDKIKKIMQDTLREADKTAKRSIMKIQKSAGTAKAAIEEAMRKVIETKE